MQTHIHASVRMLVIWHRQCQLYLSASGTCKGSSWLALDRRKMFDDSLNQSRVYLSHVHLLSHVNSVIVLNLAIRKYLTLAIIIQPMVYTLHNNKISLDHINAHILLHSMFNARVKKTQQQLHTHTPIASVLSCVFSLHIGSCHRTVKLL